MLKHLNRQLLKGLQLGSRILQQNIYTSTQGFSSTADLEAESVEQVKNREVLRVLNSDSRDMFRNVAIIAHVDHGKTTLVDSLLRGSGCANEYQSMDSNQLEKEKGITILSKCTGVTYKGYKINIVDTPGHHDFGGEVERIMDMVDGVCLLVCATEGPMAQTKFVLQKALKQKLRPIVVINKVDRPTARPKEVEQEVFNLFCDLDAADETLDYPLFYSSGKEGWVKTTADGEKGSPELILDKIIDYVPAPKTGSESSFEMLVSQTESHPYFGRIVIGKINQGEVKVNDKLSVVDSTGKIIENSKVFKILRRYGMSQMEMARAVAGDIVQIAGFSTALVSHTLNEQGKTTSIPSLPIDPPMMSITLSVNNSPIAGNEGGKLTIGMIKDRLKRETENDVALKIRKDDDIGGEVTIMGRGDLHLAVLIEKMRREGFELSVSPPEIVTQVDEKTGAILEPIEKVSIELDAQYTSSVIEKMGLRKGIYEDCLDLGGDKQKLIFSVPTRGLVGLRSEILNDTKGTGVVQQQFIGFQEWRGSLKKNIKGAILSMASGNCTAYALEDIQKFGQLFIKPGQKVYPGMVIGENRLSEGDVEVNPIREKKLTNVRSVMADDKIVVNPPRTFSLEDVIAYIRDDELVEVTPKEIRIRKKELDSSLRKKQKRDSKK